MDIILKRRSIRKFKSNKIPDNDIINILRAGMSAPSAGNGRPWHYIVINDRNILDKIPEIHPYSLMVKQAPVAILVCADTTKGKHQHYYQQDCAAAVENMLLEASYKSIGSVWLGICPVEERMKGFKNLFSLPDHIIPFALIPLGYPDEEKPYVDRYDETLVSYNKF